MENVWRSYVEVMKIVIPFENIIRYKKGGKNIE